MRKSIAALAALGLFAGAGMAYADTATGVLTEVDEEAMTITLDDGGTFMVPEDYQFNDIQVGNRVTVTYEAEGDTNVATAIIESSE